MGRPGGLVALGLLATLALGVTSVVDAVGGSTVDADETVVVPVEPQAVRSAYTDGNGLFTLDLTALPDPAALDGRRIAVRIGAGEARVIVPEGVVVRVDAAVEYAGSIDVQGGPEDPGTGPPREGVNPTLRTQLGRATPGSPVLDLEVDARIGQITVTRD